MHVFFSGVPLMECWHVDDTSPENTIVGLPRSWVDTDVSQLYSSINSPQPGGTRAPSRSPPVSWWLELHTDSSVMILLGIWTSHVAKEVEPPCFNDTWNSGSASSLHVWTVTKTLVRWLDTFVTWSVRKILPIPCTRHITTGRPPVSLIPGSWLHFFGHNGTCGFQAGSPLSH